MRRHGALLTVGRPGALRRRELVGLDAVSPADGTGFVAVDERGIARMPHGPQRLRHRTNADAPARASPRQDPQGRQGGRDPIQRPLAARPQHDQRGCQRTAELPHSDPHSHKSADMVQGYTRDSDRWERVG